MTDTPIRFIRKARVLQELDVTQSTLHTWVARGLFPAPHVLNPGATREIVGWRADEVEAWKASRPNRSARPTRKSPYPQGLPRPPRKPKPAAEDMP